MIDRQIFAKKVRFGPAVLSHTQNSGPWAYRYFDVYRCEPDTESLSHTFTINLRRQHFQKLST